MLDQLTALHAYMFFGMASLLAILELMVPARHATTSITRRWCSNIGLCLINLSLYRLFIPITAVAFSQYTLTQDGRLLQGLNIGGVLLIIIGVLLLDFIKYLEHRLFHSISPLWRMHLVHHSDTDLDFTSTERHHPLEYALGIILLYGSIYLFGITALSIVIYLIAGTMVAFVSHANVRIPPNFDKVCTYLLVTPLFHRIHHSPNKNKTNSNYGLLLTIWDRLFNTYHKPEIESAQTFLFGLEYYREPQNGTLSRLLFLPLLPLPYKNLTEVAPEKLTD